MKISITLPSIYEPACLRALQNVRDATRCNYEIILVSPFEPPHGFRHIYWIKEEPAQASGCNAGHARALGFMAGDFIMPWVDDHLLADGWDIDLLREYEKREALFHKGAPEKPFVLGLHHCWPRHVGTEFGIYYPYFPFFRRRYVEEIGWFDSAFKKGFADSDLALRVWRAGGRCEWSAREQIVAHPDDNRKAGVVFEPADMDLFLRRWAPVYGKGWRTGNLRDFNMDVESASFPALAGEQTFFRNDPSFRDAILAGGWRP